MAQHVKAENRKGGPNKDAVRRNRELDLRHINMQNRSTRIFKDQKFAEGKQAANPEAKELKRKASQRQRKYNVMIKAEELIDRGYASNEEGHAEEKDGVIMKGLPFLLNQINQGKESDVEKQFELVKTQAMEIEATKKRNKELEQQVKDKDAKIDSLEKEVELLKRKPCSTGRSRRSASTC